MYLWTISLYIFKEKKGLKQGKLGGGCWWESNLGLGSLRLAHVLGSVGCPSPLQITLIGRLAVSSLLFLSFSLLLKCLFKSHWLQSSDFPLTPGLGRDLNIFLVGSQFGAHSGALRGLQFGCNSGNLQPKTRFPSKEKTKVEAAAECSLTYLMMFSPVGVFVDAGPGSGAASKDTTLGAFW